MTAHELARKLLSGPDKPVHYAYPAKDYWRSMIAQEVGGVTEGLVYLNVYHDTTVLVNESEDEVKADTREVIVIR